ALTYGFTAALIAFLVLISGVLVAAPIALKHLGLRTDILMAARWPLVFAIAAGAFTVVYRFGPSREPARWRWLVAGAVLPAVLWRVGSAGYARGSASTRLGKSASVRSNPDMTAPHRIVLVGFAGAQVLDIVGPLEVFARTARWLADRRLADGPSYETELVGLTAGPIATSGGLQLAARRSFREVAAADTLLVAGGIGWEAAARD